MIDEKSETFITKLQGELEQYKQRISREHTEHLKQLEELPLLHQRIDQLIKQIEQTNSLHSETTQRLDNYQQSIVPQLEGEREAIRKNLDESTQIIGDLTKKIISLQENVKNIQTEKESLANQLKKLQKEEEGKRGQLQEKWSKAKKDLLDSKRDHSILEKKLQQMLEGLQAKEVETNTILKNKEDTIRTQEQRAKNLLTANEQMKALEYEYKELIAAKDEEISQLEENYRSLKQQSSQWATKYQREEQTIHQLMKQLQELEEDREEKTKLIGSLSMEMKETNEWKEELKERQKTEQKELESLMEDLEALHSVLQEKDGQIQQLNKLLSNSKHYSELIETKEAEMMEILAELEEQKRRNDELSRQLQDIHINGGSKEDAIRQLKEEKLELKRELNQKKEELERIHYENQNQKQLKVLEERWAKSFSKNQPPLKYRTTSPSSPTIASYENTNNNPHRSPLNSPTTGRGFTPNSETLFYKQKLSETKYELDSCKHKLFKLQQVLDETTKSHQVELKKRVEEMQSLLEMVEKATKSKIIHERRYQISQNQ